MMRVLVLAAWLALAASASAGEHVRVLLLKGGVSSAPEKGERLSRLDSLEGTLLFGPLRYSGQLEIWRGEKGLYVINKVPFEEYVEGVVKAETGRDWPLEALKAQAVVVRTYVLYQKLRKSGKKYHITSSALHQLYNGRNADPMVSRAVKETEGEILTYGGEPIASYYHSTSGGMTELPEEVFGKSHPYLKPMASSCNLSPLCLWARRIPLSDLEEATNTKDISGAAIKSYTATGRVKEIEIKANPRAITVEAKDLRRLLGWRRLPSTSFTLKIENGSAVFEGKGYGHGVGLCQWSALEMALKGKAYREILSSFYAGVEVVKHEARGL